MVRRTINHMFCCRLCLTIINNEVEVIYKENGIVVINNASNIFLSPTMELITLCSECQHPVGYCLEQNLLCPGHEHKIVLQRGLLSIVKD